MGGRALVIDFGDFRVSAGIVQGEALTILDFDGRPWLASPVRRDDADRGPVEQGSVTPDEVVALLGRILEAADPFADDLAPGGVWITGPAVTRGGPEAERLSEAARLAGFDDVQLVPEPIALVEALPEGRLQIGERVAVFDLKEDGLEVSLLQRSTRSFVLLELQRHDLGIDALDSGLASRLAELIAGVMEALASEIEIAGPVVAVLLAGSAADVPGLGNAFGDQPAFVPEPTDDPAAALRGLAELSRRAEGDDRRGAAEPPDGYEQADRVDDHDIAFGEQHLPTLAALGDPDGSAVGSPPEPFDDDVQFTVYRPLAIRPERWHTALVFAHKTDPVVDEIVGLSDPVEEVRKQASARLGASVGDYSTATQDSSQSLLRGSELTLAPYVEGVEFNPPQRSFLWEEPVHVEEFRLRAPAGLLGKRVRGSLAVYRGAILIAEVGLSMQVGEVDRPPVASHARPYRKIFFSYSHYDKVIVDQVEWALTCLGDEVLRDARALRSGEVWDQRIEQMIREAEIFQLFWSTNSIRSEWVAKEWRFALGLSRANFVRPTYWEQPLPELPAAGLPPAELRRLHFGLLTFGSSTAGASVAPGTRAVATGTAPATTSTLEHEQRATLEGSLAGDAPQGMPAASEPVKPTSLPPAAPIPSTPPQSAPPGASASRHGPASASRLERRGHFLKVGSGLLALVLVASLISSSRLFFGSSGVHGRLSAPDVNSPALSLTSASPPPAATTESSPPSASPPGRSCGGCVVRRGVGSTDVGPVVAEQGLLEWSSEGGDLVTILLDGGVVAAGEDHGIVPLPRHFHGDLRVESEGAWSVVTR